MIPETIMRDTNIPDLVREEREDVCSFCAKPAGTYKFVSRKKYESKGTTEVQQWVAAVICAKCVGELAVTLINAGATLADEVAKEQGRYKPIEVSP